MTKADYTHMALIVDRSGSMTDIARDMNGGIKTLLADQAKLPGELLVDVCTFDSVVEFPFTNVHPESITEDLVNPRGSTALNDAIGVTVARLGNKFRALSEDERPANVIVVVVTDGMENASREYTADQVKALVEQQTGEWGWTFLYLAANVDAFATGSAYGFAPGQTMSYQASPKGARKMSETLNASATRTRSGLSADFTEEERAENASH